jgi:hypothetical protein
MRAHLCTDYGGTVTVGVPLAAPFLLDRKAIRAQQAAPLQARILCCAKCRSLSTNPSVKVSNHGNEKRSAKFYKGHLSGRFESRIEIRATLGLEMQEIRRHFDDP